MPKLNYTHTKRACYLGYIIQASLAHLTPLLLLIFSRQFEIPLKQATLLLTTNFMVQLIVDCFAIRFAGRMGYRACAMVANICAALGLAGMALWPFVLPDPFVGLLLGVATYAVGGGFFDVIISPIIEGCPSDNKAGSMCLVHSFFCWGMVMVIVLSTGFLAVFGQQSWRVLTCLWALLPLVNTVYFALVPITEPEEGITFRKLISQRVFILLILLSVLASAAELAMSQWASAFAESGLGITKTWGDLAGPCMFGVLMGISRVFYAKFGKRIELMPFLIGCGALCCLSFLLAALSPFPLLALAGCALCGLSVGVMCPGLFSLGAARYPAGGAVMFAVFSLAGDIGSTGGPALVGAVSGVFGGRLQPGLLAAIVFPLAFMALCVLYQKRYGGSNVIPFPLRRRVRRCSVK